MRKNFQRGQVLIFYAFLLPIIFLFAGVGIDFGWYYLNVSRLQNAADAAVLAGAQIIVGNGSELENYYIVQLKDLPKYSLTDYKDFDKDTLKEARNQVEKYASLNLSDPNANLAESGDTASDEWQSVTAIDGWSLSADDKNRTVTGKVQLMRSLAEDHNEEKTSFYYWLDLSENIRHLFLPGWFAPMSAPVHSVVLLQPRDKNLYEATTGLKNDNTVLNWQYQNNRKNESDNPNVYKGNWNHYKAGKNSAGNFNDNIGIRYTAGNAYRTESVLVTAEFNTGSAERTPANGGKFYSETEVDALNIDARAETRISFNKFGGLDWDIGQELSGVSYNYNKEPDYSWDIGNGDDKRILFNVEFNDNFETRTDTDGTKMLSDPLWVGIESDPISDGIGGNNTSGAYNSVRQFILNFNEDNTATEGTGKNKRYTYRPYFVFYTGPETINEGIGKNGQLVRYSRPVVINLNEDLNAIFYLPNSPVIINGNDHKLTGFVMAKCYLNSLTADDMTKGKNVTLYDGFNPTETFKGDCIEGTDGNGNTVYVHKNDLLDKDDIDDFVESLGETADQTFDSNSISVYNQLPIPKYILVNYTQADSQAYSVKEKNGKHNEIKTFAAYINATYKETFKDFSKLDDSQITAITFPDENYNETTAVYYVATADLHNSSQGDSDVKVLADGVTKYVDKAKLPYFKVRTDKEYFFVCIYDLKLTESGGKGVRMIDNNYTDEEMNSSYGKSGNITTTIADIYDPKTTVVNQYGDTWAVDRNWYNGSHNDWKKNKLTLSEVTEGDEIKYYYFMLNSDIAALGSSKTLLAKYRKLTVKGVEKYVDELNKDYFTKVKCNENNEDNYIIVNKNGNILTKPLTAPQIFDEESKTESRNKSFKNMVLDFLKLDSYTTLLDYYKKYTREPKDPEEIPLDEGTVINGLYRSLDNKHQNEDYRIPAFERVYKNSAFNLSGDSRYSYFQIESLGRINYNYMNVDELGKDDDVKDMFFTTIRAAWID